MNKIDKMQNYLNRGIIEAHLNFARENNSNFSIVKFRYKMDKYDAFTFKNLISFIHIQIDFKPILYLSDDTFIFFLSNLKIYQAKAVIKRLNNKIQYKFNFEIKDIGITENDINDQYKTLIDRLDKYFIMSKLSSSKKMFYGTVDFDYYDNMDPLKAFRRIFKKSNKIRLNNIYKGIPVHEDAIIKGFGEGFLQISIKSEKLSFYKKKKFSYLQHDLIPNIIKADIKKVDISRQLIILENLQLVENSPVERSDTRVEPINKIYAILTKNHKKIADGRVINISENSISLDCKVGQISNILFENNFQMELEIKFQLPNIKNLVSQMKIKASIFNIIENKIIITIFPNSIEKTRLKEYILTQQNQILLQLKQQLKSNI